MNAPAPAGRRDTALRLASIAGGVLGYGSLAVFLCLIGVQIYRWFSLGEWTHFGVSEGLSVALNRCCVNAGDAGRLARLVDWLDAPEHWLGLHRVFEVMPASLALFVLSMLGNSLFVYCRDRLPRRR